jgi:hypothetical protein
MTKVDVPHGSAAFFVGVAVALLGLMLGAVLLWPADFTAEMGAFPFVSLAFGLVRALIAVGFTWITLRLMDHVGQCLPGPMLAPFTTMSQKPEALAVYYGLRFVAVAYLYASALG